MDIRRTLFAFAFLAAAVLTVGSAGAADPGEARKAIEAVNQQIGEAISRGDAAAFAGLYTEDGAVLPPDAPMIQGRNQIETFWKDGFASGIKAAKLEALEVENLGDTAWERGTATLTIEPEGQAAVTQKIKYLVVWKRQPDGQWKLHRDIWNTLPAEGPKAE